MTPRYVYYAIREAHEILSMLDSTIVPKTEQINVLILRLRVALDRANFELAKVRQDLHASIEKL